MSSRTRDINTIRKIGLEALLERLGPVDMVEFMQQFDSGYGNCRESDLLGLII